MKKKVRRVLFATYWGIIIILFCAVNVYAAAAPAENLTPGIQIPIPKPVIISAPSDLTAVSNTAGKVTLTWKDNSSNETGFMIERRMENYSDSYLNVGFSPANTTSYTESETGMHPIFPGEKYYYRIKAYNDSGHSAYSNEAFVTVKKKKPPTPASMFKAEIVTSTMGHPVQLTWDDNSDDETKYVVQRQKAGCGFEIIMELPPDTTEYRDTATLQKDIEYTYRVEVFNNYGSAYSNYSSVVMPSSAPSSPQYFTAVAQGPTSIKLMWTDTSDNEDGFWIGRKSGNGAYPPSTNPTYDLAANTTELVDYGLEPDTEYSYIIAGYNALYSSFIAETKCKTGPKAPINLTATAVSGNEIKLTWENLSAQVNTYTIERKVEGGTFSQITSLMNPQELAYSDTTVLPEKTYTYRVKAWRVFYPSDYSAEVTATTPALSFIKIPVITTGKTVIKLNIGQTAFQVNNDERKMDVAPISREGRTMLPIKYITDALGAALTWDGTAQKVTVTKGTTVIELWIGQNIAKVNGVETMIDTANPNVQPILVPPGRTMLPLRFISESLGCEVDWNQELQEASLTHSSQ